MTIAPTRGQLRVLRLMAAGVNLHAPAADATRYTLRVGQAASSSVEPTTIEPMLVAGWVRAGATDLITLTTTGRAQAECSACVRGWAEGLRA